MRLASFIPTTTMPTSSFSHPFLVFKPQFRPDSLSLNPRNIQNCLHFCCYAAKQQQSGSVKKRSQPSSTNKKRKNKGGFGSVDDFEIVDEEQFSMRNKGSGVVDDFVIEDGFEIIGDGDENEFPQSSPPLKSKSKSNPNSKLGSKSKRSPSKSRESYQPLPLPKPPAGFVLDDRGKVLLASDKRIVTIVDPTNNCPLECVIRRVFRSSRGDECMLVCPVDMPVQILKSTNFDGWSAISEDEVEGLVPTASYVLAKIHMHFVPSGFCFTARGGYCYTEDELFEVHTDNDQDHGARTEGVEIASFDKDGSHYMVYTPTDPLLFVVVKDQNGQLQMAEDDILDDPAIASAIDEETEFNALVEEEQALLDSLWGKDIPLH